jgi:hypothetical protein
VASAEVLLFSVNPRFINFRAAPIILDLNGEAAGGTQLTSATTQANQRVVITFNAFCAIDFSPERPVDEAAGYVAIQILVDPAGSVGEFSAPPTESGRRFCWAKNTDINGSSATVVASVKPAVAGTHKVRVQAVVSPGPFTTARPFGVVGELSLTVTR